MKKLKNYILLFISLFLILTTKTYAQELDIQTLGKLVLNDHPKISSFYVIGEYVFTSDFIASDNLNTQDIMISARSIDLRDDHTELIKGTIAYNKMSIYTIRARKNIEGKIESWYVGDNLILNTSTIDDDAKLNIKYIDYKKAKNVYTVTFKDDENRELEKQYVIDGKNAISPKIEEREGYDFVGWFKCTDGDSCGNVEQNKFDLETATINGDITLKAKWEIHKFNVTFDKDGGEGSISNQEIEYNKKASSPEVSPTKEGYDFKGWFKCTSLDDCSNIANEDTPFNFDGTEIKEDIKLKAKWEIKKFTVTFDKDSTDGDAIPNQTIEYGKTASQPTSNLKKNGYKFLGWFKCTGPDSCENIASEQNAFDFKTEIKENITLKAKWEEVTYTITFKGEIDGVSNDAFVSDKKTLTLKYPYNIKDTSNIPTTNQEGYDFLGWYNEKNSPVQLNENYYISGNTTITGKWKTKEYTVTYKDYNKSDYKILKLKYNTKIDQENELERPSDNKYNNYVFKGWYKCNDSKCDSYADAKFDFAKDGKAIKENLTLIAVYDQVVNTTEIISDFTENMNSEDFSAYVSDKNVTLNVLKKDTDLNTNFEKFVSAMQKVLNVHNVSKVTVGYNDQTKDLDSGSLESQLQELITTLSGKDLTSSHFSDLVDANDSFTIKLTLAEGIKNEENQDNITYTVKFVTKDFVYVNSEDELKSNLNSNKEIVINKDFSITNEISITNDIVIDGNGKTLTSNITNSKYTFNITSGNVVIKDLTLKIYTLLPTEYDKVSKESLVGIKNTIGFKVEKEASLMVTKVKVDGNRVINRDQLTIDSEPFNSTNVVINENAAIELYGALTGSGLNYTSEIYGSPTVLAKNDATMNLGGMNHQKYIYNVKRTNELNDSCDSIERIDEFVHYYSDYNNSYITFAWYSPDSGSKIYFTYIYKEYLVLPKIFTENGKYNTYSKDGNNYVFDHWTIRDELKNLSNDELIKKQVLKNEIIYIYAQYNVKS